MKGLVELRPKHTGETRLYTFDFTGQLAPGESISSAAVSAATYSGTDTNPSALISGSPTVSGAVVRQNLTGGTLGVLYRVTCDATTSANRTLQLHGYLAITPTVP